LASISFVASINRAGIVIITVNINMNTSSGSVTRIIRTGIFIIARDRGVRASTLGKAVIVGTGVTVFTNNKILYTTASAVADLGRTIIGIITVNLHVCASS